MELRQTTLFGKHSKEAFVYARPKDSYQTFIEFYSTQLTAVLPGRMLQEVH